MEAGTVTNTGIEHLAEAPARRVSHSANLLANRHTVAGCAGVLFAVAFLAGLVTLLAPPRLSLVLGAPPQSQAQVNWVLPGSHLWDVGVRRGERVLALDGRAITRSQTGLWMGRSIELGTRSGNMHTFSAARILTMGDTWPLLALSPWFLVLGTLVFLRAPQREIAWAAHALFACSAIALALAPAADGDNLFALVAEFVVVIFFATSFAHFFLVFPRRRGAALRQWLFVPSGLVLVIYACSVVALPVAIDIAYLLRLALLAVYVLFGTSLLTHALVTTQDPSVRRGLLFMCGGTVAAIAPFVLFFLVPSLLGRPIVLSAEHAALALPLLPAGFAYAILRHDLLPVNLLQRWMVSAIIGSSLACLLAGAGVLLLRALPADGSSRSLWHFAASLLLVSAACVALPRAYAATQATADRVLFRDRYDYRVALQALSRDLSLLHDPDGLDGTLLQKLRRLMNLDFAVLLIRSDEGASVYGTAGDIETALLRELIVWASEVTDTPRTVMLGDAAVWVLLVPLRTRNALVGHLCLGPKATGEPFRPEDRALLATLSGHLAAVVRNAALMVDLQVRVRDLAENRTALVALN